MSPISYLAHERAKTKGDVVDQKGNGGRRHHQSPLMRLEPRVERGEKAREKGWAAQRG